MSVILGLGPAGMNAFYQGTFNITNELSNQENENNFNTCL